MDQQQLISSVVSEVLSRLGPDATGFATASVNGNGHGYASNSAAHSNGSGRFADVDTAVASAARAQQQLAGEGLAARDTICKLIKKLCNDNAAEWGRIELQETGVGRLDHKIAKLELINSVPGVEFLTSPPAHSGDDGIAIDEAAPWGVIGVVTPVTHSIPTMSANAVNMIAAGNALVINAHPSGANCLAMAAEAFNRAIKSETGIDPLVCAIDPPTLDTANALFSHPDVPLLVATGGPAVARAAMKQPKRSIVAGPGNPPVVIDETADLDRAAESIIAGASFDNNLLCIGEKEVFVVASVFDRMMAAMRRAGAVELADGGIQKLTDAAFKWHKDHHAVQKELVGKDPHVLGQAAGVNVAQNVELLFGACDEANPFVPEEQMMPFVPFVKVRDFDEALAMAVKHEHGFGHTAIIHSNNLARITEMGRVMNTTIFVANGPCTGGLGIGGEGYPSYSIATPTGEGITNPLTFTRFRRMGVSGALRIV